MFFTSLLHRLFALWCRVYNWFESEYYPDIVIPKYTYGVEISQSWRNLILDYSIEYHKDKWYMLCDVISIPVAILSRGWGDCDDFARLAHSFFGESFLYEGSTFKFKGLYALIYSKKPHHMVAVWENSLGCVISAGDVHRVRVHSNFRSFEADFGRNSSGHSLKGLSRFLIISGKVYYKNTFKVS